MADPRPTREEIVAYAGSSMFPLFQPGDLLVMCPASLEAVAAGDCVVYRGQEGDLAVHRVVAAGERLVTRGDNRPGPDDEPVAPERLAGLVTHRIRAGRRTPVRGGRHGMLLARLARLAARLDPESQGRGGAVARFLRLLMLPLERVLRGRVRAVRFIGEGTTLLLGRRGIGAWDNHRGAWEVLWPWRLIFRGDDLPVAGGAGSE